MVHSLFVTYKFGALVYLFVSFLFNITTSIAQTNGCHVSYSNSDRLYFMPYPAGGANAFITTGTIDVTGATGGYRANESNTYGCIADVGGTCVVYQQYEVSPGPPQVVGTRIYRMGISASISPTNCPIDDYISSLFVFAIGIFYIRLNNISSLGNESKHHHGSL